MPTNLTTFLSGTVAIGYTGSRGATGFTGSIGTQGPIGYTGSAGTVSVTNDTSTNATRYITFTDASTGSITGVNVSSTKLYFNPSTGDLSATNFNSLSDAAFKENFENIEDVFSILEKINTYKFDWKDTKTKSYGVIAQELEKILPELVNTNNNGFKTVSYIPLIVLLINAVKELNERINQI